LKLKNMLKSDYYDASCIIRTFSLGFAKFVNEVLSKRYILLRYFIINII